MGKKPYAQKKTGHAHRGSQRTPFRPDGSVIFGLKPKDWSIKMNCKEKRPTIAYDQQGLVFAVAMEGSVIKLFDSRSYDKGTFDTFLVGGDTAEVYDIKFTNGGKSML